jgi:1-acyl-sn-glycerol-3-phosphate acyltransferase
MLLQVAILDDTRRHRWVSGLLQKKCQKILRSLGFTLVIKGQHLAKLGANETALILPNHISYLDVIAIHAVLPAVFVTSRDIEATPFLGSLCRSGGCAFVNRRSRKDLLRDIDQLSTLLNRSRGTKVVLFPEGTTSPGASILPYKKSLLEAAIRSKSKVYPVCIRYTEVDGQPVDLKSRDRFAWYGDMTFFPHLWQLMSLRSLTIEIITSEAVAFRSHQCRKRLTGDVEQVARSLFLS